LAARSDSPVRGLENREIYDHHTDSVSLYGKAYFNVFGEAC